MTGHRLVRALSRIALGALLLGAPAGCAHYKHEVPPLSDDVRRQIGEVSVEVTPDRSAVGLDKPFSGKGRGALAGAGASVLAGVMAGLQTGDPTGLAVLTALGIAAAPMGAIIGAIVTPTTESVDVAQAQLTEAINATDWEAQLRTSFEAAMAARPAPAPSAQEARLGLWIDGPWLVLDGRDSLPSLIVHAEMRAEGKCLVDRRWQWTGDEMDYLSLGENGAEAFRRQLMSGVTGLGEAIASDLFLATEPRVVDYLNKESTDGGFPLLVLRPHDFEEAIASWDSTGEASDRCRRSASAVAVSKSESSSPAASTQTDEIPAPSSPHTTRPAGGDIRSGRSM